jgi:hypothetical protein
MSPPTSFQYSPRPTTTDKNKTAPSSNPSGYSYHTFPPPQLKSNPSHHTSNFHHQEETYYETLDFFSDYLRPAQMIKKSPATATAAATTERGWQAVRQEKVRVIFVIVVVLAAMGWAVASVGRAVSGQYTDSLGEGSRDAAGMLCTDARPRFCQFIVGLRGEER